MTVRDDFPIDELAGILPLAIGDRLAEMLSRSEFNTLTQLADAGAGRNSLRALASDLGDLEAWPRCSGTRRNAREFPSMACRKRSPRRWAPRVD
jgi:hypothetical protein